MPLKISKELVMLVRFWEEKVTDYGSGVGGNYTCPSILFKLFEFFNNHQSNIKSEGNTR